MFIKIFNIKIIDKFPQNNVFSKHFLKKRLTKYNSGSSISEYNLLKLGIEKWILTNFLKSIRQF